MKINQACFVTSVCDAHSFPEGNVPQITVAGKSNVGKSSLINCLANQKKLARTSQQPGQTRLINLYLFNDRFHLVDLPGYGYAKVSKKMREEWGQLMNEFLTESLLQKHIFLLVDIRHEPGEHDQNMAAWILDADIPYTIVATKADKLSKSQQQRALGVISRTLGIPINTIIPFSSVTKQGKEELLTRIENAL